MSAASDPRKAGSSWPLGAWLVILALVAVPVLTLLGVVHSGIGARSDPGAVEALLAREVRRLAIPSRARSLVNPIAPSDEVVGMGRAHWADHCANCHGNDGSGETVIGKGLYPRAPDMRLAATQDLSDGELFFIIENGVRFTGMPAWGSPGHEGDEATWHLVHFIRHLPKLTVAESREMEELNPKTPSELAEQRSIDDFLAGGTAEPSAAPSP